MIRMNKIAIHLSNVSKKYEIHHEKPTLVEKFVKGPNETFWALRDVNLIIQKGDRVGIVGPNGSGKTTILKIIAGIATPTSGTVTTRGKIVSLIDLEAGFHPDLTGEQNIYLNGMILGMTKKEITKKLDAIIRFADIKQFIDTPLFTYSQGMKLRLGFAVAIHANPAILILDEGLGVGDEAFQKKVQKRIHTLFQSGITVLIASHWYQFIKNNCKTLIKMEAGVIIYNGQITHASLKE